MNSISLFNDNNLELVPKIEALRDFGENQKEEYKMKHIKRLKEGKCTVEGGIAFLELISVCGKIIEHCCNVNFGIVP